MRHLTPNLSLLLISRMLLQPVLAQVRHFPGGVTLSWRRHQLSARASSGDSGDSGDAGVAAAPAHTVKRFKTKSEEAFMMF